jgi:hypothetical protein
MHKLLLLLVPAGCMFGALAAIRTGRFLGKGAKSYTYRDRDPVWFWGVIVVMLLIAAMDAVAVIVGIIP